MGHLANQTTSEGTDKNARKDSGFQMRIVGLEKQSLVDYPDHLAAVLFTPGCNFDCHYCHNRHLLSPDAEDHALDVEKVLGFLAIRTEWLEGVVVTGGEPTLQEDLVDFLETSLRPLGLLIKLDTNGTHPEMLREIIARGLVDYVAMDVKAPLHRYAAIARTAVDNHLIQKSIDLLMAGDVDYEFRTTFAPPIRLAAIVRIARHIHGAKRYAVQQYRPIGRGMNMFGVTESIEPYPPSLLRRAVELAGPHVQECLVRGLDVQWDPQEEKLHENNELNA